MNIHYGMDIDLDKVVVSFGGEHPRRMILTNVLSTDDLVTKKEHR